MIYIKTFSFSHFSFLVQISRTRIQKQHFCSTTALCFGSVTTQNTQRVRFTSCSRVDSESNSFLDARVSLETDETTSLCYLGPHPSVSRLQNLSEVGGEPTPGSLNHFWIVVCWTKRSFLSGVQITD